MVMLKDKMKEGYRSPAVMKYSWTFIAERFGHFLVQKPEGPNNGLLLIDASRKNPESDIRRAVQKTIKGGGVWKGIDHVIEQPIFVESHTHNLIQLADMIAYVALKHYKGDSNSEGLFETKPKMYRFGGRLEGFGLKEFPWVCRSGSRSAQLRGICFPKPHACGSTLTSVYYLIG